MQVLHIVPNIDPRQGGPARSVQSLVAAQRRMDGVDVKLAAAGPIELVDYSLRIRSRFSIPTREAVNTLRTAIQNSDIVELHSLWNGVISFAGKLCRELKKPYLYTPRGMLDPYCLKTRGWLKKLSAWMGEEKNIAGAAGFHLLSEEEKQGLLSVRPYLKNREFVIAPNGLGQVPEEIRPGLIKERFPETQGMKTLLFLGRLDEIKGLELPLEAVAQLEPKLRPMVLLVGPDFGVEARLRELVSKLGIAPWVLFAGPIYGDDRFSLLYEADIVGLTSHYECNSVTGTETFAVGGCMLATEGTSLRHAGQANAAWIVPRTVQAYADGLRKLLTDDLLRHQLRQSAKLYAQRHLDWDRLVKPIIECYKRILERKT